MGSTSSDAEKSVHSCAHCRKDATLVCNGCHHAPGLNGGKVETVWYCSPDCQIADISQHEFACKKAQNFRAVYRAGATAQLACYRYLEKFEDPTYTRVEKKGDDLYNYYPDNDDESPMVSPFLWKTCDNEEDRLMLLTYMMCGNSTGFTHVLVDIMLQDIIQEVVRVDYQSKAHRRQVIRVGSDGYHDDNTDQIHCIIRVTLKNDEEYAFDITGPQYGFYDPVVPWKHYAESRIKEIVTVFPLRDAEECQKVAGSKAGGVGPEKRQEEQFGEIFVTAAKSWQVTNGPLDGMLNLRETTFKKKQASLVDFIDTEVTKFKEKTGTKEVPACFISKGYNYGEDHVARVSDS